MSTSGLIVTKLSIDGEVSFIAKDFGSINNRAGQRGKVKRNCPASHCDKGEQRQDRGAHPLQVRRYCGILEIYPR
jgi:hypothetical protein